MKSQKGKIEIKNKICCSKVPALSDRSRGCVENPDLNLGGPGVEILQDQSQRWGPGIQDGGPRLQDWSRDGDQHQEPVKWQKCSGKGLEERVS